MRIPSLAPKLLVVACALAAAHCDGGDGGDTSTSTTGGSTTTTDTPTGGSGGSSPTGGTGGSDTGSGGSGGGAGGGSADACAGRMLCEDFEDDAEGAAPAAPWQTSTNQGSVMIDGTHARSGTKAVKVRTEAGQYKQAFFYVQGAPVFPAPGNVIYGRMMIYMDQTANDGVHWTMIQGSGPLEGHDGVTAHYRYGGMHDGKMMGNYETSGAATDCWNNSEDVMPTGKWTCMEWRFDGPNNEMRFWLDGAELPGLHVKDEGQGCIGHDLDDQWLAPTFERMYLGWESYQQDPAREAWIDDVILDDEPIGCPQ